MMGGLAENIAVLVIEKIVRWERREREREEERQRERFREKLGGFGDRDGH
jgi:hypothetical protein